MMKLAVFAFILGLYLMSTGQEEVAIIFFIMGGMIFIRGLFDKQKEEKRKQEEEEARKQRKLEEEALKIKIDKYVEKGMGAVSREKVKAFETFYSKDGLTNLLNKAMTDDEQAINDLVEIFRDSRFQIDNSENTFAETLTHILFSRETSKSTRQKLWELRYKTVYIDEWSEYENVEYENYTRGEWVKKSETYSFIDYLYKYHKQKIEIIEKF
ncbi:MAG: hypothetical protein Fur0022_22960 [Anaerolineales bacterium]